MTELVPGSREILAPASAPLKNEKHEAFCFKYVETGNASEAYVAAGFARSGSRQSAAKLLQRPYIQARIADIRSRVSAALAAKGLGTAAERAPLTGIVSQTPEEMAAVTAERLTSVVDRKQRILEELELLGFSSVGNYQVDDDGWVTVQGDLPPELIRAVESVQVDKKVLQVAGEGRVIEIKTRFKLWSKPTALKMLGDHELLFGEQPERGRSSDRPAQIFIIAGREVYL